jgi:hypothetical protein
MFQIKKNQNFKLDRKSPLVIHSNETSIKGQVEMALRRFQVILSKL